MNALLDRIRLVLLVSAALTIPFAPAAAEDQSTDSILVLGQQHQALTDVATTGSRLGLTPLETPASVYVIDGDAIRARGDLSIMEAESRAPGIANAGNLGNGGTALSARGFSGQGSALQLIDGVRLFPVAGTITFPTDPWMADRIEVLNGPASVLYGQGALGGAVNVLTRQPNLTRTEMEGEIGGGSQDSYHAAAGIGGPVGSRLGYQADVSYRRSDGYVSRGDSRSIALSGTLLWKPTETLTLALRDDFGRQRPMRYFGTPLVDNRLDKSIRRRNYNVADANVRFRDNRTALQTDWSPGGAISITNTAYRLTSDRSWRNLESYCWIAADGFCPNGYNGSAGTPGRIYRTDNLGIGHDQVQWGDQGSIKIAMPLAAGIANTLVAGFDVNLVKLTYSHNFGSDPQIDEVAPTGFSPGRFFDTQGVAPRYRTRTNEYAFFAENRLKLGETVSVVGGLRAERDRIRRWTIAEASETFALEKRLHNTTWRVGGVYQPRPTLSFYAQYATGVDPLGTLTTYSTGQVQYSNATGDQVEAGAKATFLNGHGTATIAAYKIVKKKLLAQQTPTSPIEQVGQRSAKGIEASLSLDVTAGFGIEANGSLLNARFDDFLSGTADYRGNTPPGVPERTANLWLRWDATDRLQARGGLRHVGRSYSDNANTFRVPAYTVLDATFSFALTPRVVVDLRLYNLTDRAYAITAYNDQQWVLGRPRSFDLAVRAAF